MRERKKVILWWEKAGTGILVLLFLASVMLSACIEPPPEIIVEVSPHEVKPGDDITVSGWINPPQRTKLLIVEKIEVYTMADGTYSKTLHTKPKISEGKHVITVKAPDIGIVESASFVVSVPKDKIVTGIVSKVIHTSEAGTVEHPSGAKIYVPRGAVPLNKYGEEGAMPFTIKECTMEDFGIPSTPPSPGMKPLGNMYRMGPENITFQEPIRVTMPLPDGFDPARNQVIMFDYDPTAEKWISVGGRVNQEGNALSSDVMQLCFNQLFITAARGQEAWGKIKFRSTIGYSFYACIKEYTPLYPEIDGPIFDSWNYHCFIPDSGSTICPPDGLTYWALPQGEYLIQIEPRKTHQYQESEPLGYFNRKVRLDKPCWWPYYDATSVGLQTWVNINGIRPTCPGTPPEWVKKKIKKKRAEGNLTWAKNPDLEKYEVYQDF